MNPTRSGLLTIAVGLFMVAAGCTEKNMGAASNDGWSKVDTHAKSSAPQAPLEHAEAVNVTYYYLPG